MKIYTGVGDRGKTSLFSGERVPKSHLRIEAYGDVDELNSILGALVASLPPACKELAQPLQAIQSDLFHVGAWLATTPDSPAIANLQAIGQEQIQALESAIDRLEERLPPLTHFILPGGHPAATWAHLARTVCRRAERHVVRLAHESDRANLEGVIVYLNRLSDYLFVLARYCNHRLDVPETTWQA
jgi:cob(I)alamin adenosyltransferase